MFFIISVIIILVGAVILLMKSKKPLKHILAEAKYELIYNAMGSKALLEDQIMKSKNKTELFKKSEKIALITGGARGIGLEVVKMLAKCDMHIIIGCRNVKAVEKLILNFREEGIETGDIVAFKLDISSIKSVKQFASIIKEHYSKINLLINNAGIMFGPFIETVDGYESQFATNYLGHFLLTHLLLPQLIAAGTSTDNARIVNVTSCAHAAGSLNFDDINYQTQYISAAAYAQSKLAQVLFSNYLNGILKTEGHFVQVYSVHPGIVNTGLFDNTPIKTIFPFVPILFFKTPEQGANPIIHACISPHLEGKGGAYISNCRIAPASEASHSEELQKELFNFTKKLLEIDVFGKF